MVKRLPAPAAATIPRGASEHPALDFAALKAEAIDCVQRCAAEGWTDYNAHDPGVTILEQLCYALTDLGYRAGFPIEDLLAAPDGAPVQGRFGPHPPWRALPAPPVTVADFRRLLLDRVSGLGNVWLVPRPADGVADGLYDIRIQPALPLPGVHPEGRPRYRRLRERTRRVFVDHRALCEDIGTIRVLRPLRTVVRATLHLDRDAVPEAVMAEAIYRLALEMAPEPRRADLAQVAPGTTPAELFDGPLPLHGFLAPSELAAKPASIALDTLAERMADIPGVTGVRDAALWVEGSGVRTDGRYAIGGDEYCSLDAGIEGGTLPLALSMGGRPCEVDRGDVLRRLLRLWGRHRETFPLKAGYRQAFPMPAGRPRDLARFEPIAAHFPAVYGLEGGKARPATPEAAQLAGFLAIFEMLMVDYCDRLGDVQALIAGKPFGVSTMGSEAFRARIPALAWLSAPEVPEDDEIFARLRMPPEQHERLLDFLLALYGEDAGDVPVPPPLRPGSDAAARFRIDVKHALLTRFVALARRRGRGFDYRSAPSTRRLAGVELRTRILLGDHDLANPRGRHRIAFVEHMMLRPRTEERLQREAGAYRYGMALSAVLHLPHEAAGNLDYRAEVAAAIRDAVPAHIGLHVHFVDRERWRRFHRLFRLWRTALQVDERPAIDWASAGLRDLLDRWSEEEGEGGA